MANISILPCTVDDGPAIAHSSISAFWTNANWILIWPGKTCDYVVSQAKLRWSHNLLIDREHRRHLKAVDTNTGEVVGYARWHLPEGASVDLWSDAKVPAVSGERMAEVKRNYDSADWVIANTTASLDPPVIALQNRLTEGKGYLVLDYLAVHPSHRNRGIASMLVESGAREADKMGLNTFVLAFQAALNVYKRAGFQLLDQLIQDDSKLGGPGEYATYFLAREAKKK